MAITLSNPSPGVAKLSVDGVDRLTIQNGTDTTTIVGNLVFDGNLSAVDFTTSGNTIIGDGVGDSLTVNGSSLFNDIEYSGTLTGGTGVINIGSGQIFKDAAGNVGIGTSSQPNIGGAPRTVTIEKVGGQASIAVIRHSNDVVAPAIVMAKTRSLSSGGFDAVLTGDQLGTLQYVGGNGVDTTKTGAQIIGLAQNDWSATSTPANLFFSTTPTGSTIPVERLRITSAGNVGVGTASPAHKLDVRGVIAGGNGTIVGGVSFSSRAEIGAISNHDLGLIANNDTKMIINTAGNAGLGVTPSVWNTGKALEVGFAGNSVFGVGLTQFTFTQNAYFNGSYIYSTTRQASRYDQALGSHQWFTAPSGTAGNPITFTQAMTLTNGGNLLVGTTIDAGFRQLIAHSPAATAFSSATALSNQPSITALYLANSGSNNTDGTTESGIVIAAGSADSAQHGIYVQKTGGTLGNLIFRRRTGGATSAESARITAGGYFKASNTGSYAGASDSYHEFYSDQANRTVKITNTNGAPAVVNCESVLPSLANGIHYYGVLGASVVYQVLANGNVQNTNNSYGAISDAKLKENVVDTSPKLEDVKQLRVVNYNLISNPELKQIGLIAQEVEQIFPGLVDSTPDIDSEGNDLGTVTKSVKYSVLVPILLKAMQEQQEIIEDLKARLDAAGL